MGSHGYHRMEMASYAQPLRPDQIALSILQQPERGKIVSRGKERDRRSIDPPPVVRLHIQNDTNISGCSALNNPYLFCAVTLWKAEEDEPKRPESSHSGSSSSSSSGRPSLYGSTVSSLHRLKDLQNEEGGFFVFGDVSAGCSGSARLKFCVYEMFPQYTNSSEDWYQVVHLKSIVSDKIEIAQAKEWDGVKESTSLSRSFADQGVRLRLRKESRAASKRAFPIHGTVQPQMIRPVSTTHSGYDAQVQEAEEMPSAKRHRPSLSFSAYGQPSPTSTAGSYTSASYPSVPSYQNTQTAFPSQAAYGSSTSFSHFSDAYGRPSSGSSQYASNVPSYGADGANAQHTQYSYAGLPLNGGHYGSAAYPYVSSAQTQGPYFSHSASTTFGSIPTSFAQPSQPQPTQSPYAASTPQNPSYITAIAPAETAENTPRAQGHTPQQFRQPDLRTASRLPPIQQSQEASEQPMQYP